MDAYGDLWPEEMVLPQMVLVQGVSRKADAKMAGNFWNTVADDYKAQLRVAILALKRSRSLFDVGDFDSPPLCASDDAIHPRQIVEVDDMTTGPTCQKCPLSQWGTAREGKGKGQACRLSYNLLCLDLDDSQIYVVRVTGASITDFLRHFSAGRIGKTPAYAMETIVSAEHKTFAEGAAHVMTFASGELLPSAMAEQIRQVAANYKGVSLGVEGEEPEIEAEDIPFE